jgi:hypothetical protein
MKFNDSMVSATAAGLMLLVLLVGSTAAHSINTALPLVIAAGLLSYQWSGQLAQGSSPLRWCSWFILLLAGFSVLFSLVLAIGQWLLVMTPLAAKYQLGCALLWVLIVAGGLRLQQVPAWLVFWQKLGAGLLVGAFATSMVVLLLALLSYFFSDTFQ